MVPVLSRSRDIVADVTPTAAKGLILLSTNPLAPSPTVSPA
eukprot:CAMPEP_0173457004 /NCGR_PEP_ID=MMETSP1357-20121228/56987_1 /TAXON_ID=77926 /ORGANISM="Hemiselmis rufescens, Strain PCC563" /LENGTH=40 /DNA_ID= /DNA_START= /DNA_END= /DNA_ORIENTATION=